MNEQRKREIEKIELITHKQFEMIKPMYENFENMRVDKIGELLFDMMNLYIEYDTKNDDENNGYHYGMHEFFRIQIDIITNYLKNERHLTNEQIDELTFI